MLANAAHSNRLDHLRKNVACYLYSCTAKICWPAIFPAVSAYQCNQNFDWNEMKADWYYKIAIWMLCCIVLHKLGCNLKASAERSEVLAEIISELTKTVTNWTECSGCVCLSWSSQTFRSGVREWMLRVENFEFFRLDFNLGFRFGTLLRCRCLYISSFVSGCDG